ncbi:hypothetical protein [Cerasicoccus arenae]|uniref:Uncharacterized protein n=1 Tax=Cerasicoccus arenae TaxID=424488 RepID=A0A8J3GEB1_9BACT|nr:hypothetical protein [Cerasicoccus arenae]MBK1858226.1 hypothetical protein [Cerasicoccus arenae]GHC02015.1 hypothetical protein GCM10007047_18130 [Cerasicoccus arenae]
MKRLPGAVSGSGGHNATFHCACVLVIDFAFAEADAWTLLQEYNVSQCSPGWSEKELRRKLEQAFQKRDRLASSEIGRLIRDQRAGRGRSFTRQQSQSRSSRKSVQPLDDFSPIATVGKVGESDRLTGVGAEISVEFGDDIDDLDAIFADSSPDNEDSAPDFSTETEDLPSENLELVAKSEIAANDFAGLERVFGSKRAFWERYCAGIRSFLQKFGRYPTVLLVERDAAACLPVLFPKDHPEVRIEASDDAGFMTFAYCAGVMEHDPSTREMRWLTGPIAGGIGGIMETPMCMRVSARVHPHSRECREIPSQASREETGGDRSTENIVPRRGREGQGDMFAQTRGQLQ